MSKQIQYKDTNGDVQTVDFQTSYPIRIVTNSTDEWTLRTSDEINSVEITEYVGGRPKDRG